MKVEIKGDQLVITMPFNKKGTPSKSGKSMVHASTEGNKTTDVEVGGKKLVVGLNVYTPAKD